MSVQDASKLNFKDESFDICCDRATMKHCELQKIKEIVEEVHRVMKKSFYIYTAYCD